MATKLEFYLWIKSYVHTHTVVLPLESIEAKFAVGRHLHAMRKIVHVLH